MIEKLKEVINNYPSKVIWFGSEQIIVEERFGKRKEIIKNYRITSMCTENNDCIINYMVIGDETFIHSSLADDLSGTFIAQILTAII